MVTQLVHPVVFGGDEEVPGQQGADAHQEEGDVHQAVGVPGAVPHGQRHTRRRAAFAQERSAIGGGGGGALKVLAVLLLLFLLLLLGGAAAAHVRRVEAGLEGPRAVHPEDHPTNTHKAEGGREGEGEEGECKREVRVEEEGEGSTRRTLWRIEDTQRKRAFRVEIQCDTVMLLLNRIFGARYVWRPTLKRGGGGLWTISGGKSSRSILVSTMQSLVVWWESRGHS